MRNIANTQYYNQHRFLVDQPAKVIVNFLRAMFLILSNP